MTGLRSAVPGRPGGRKPAASRPDRTAGSASAAPCTAPPTTRAPRKVRARWSWLRASLAARQSRAGPSQGPSRRAARPRSPARTCRTVARSASARLPRGEGRRGGSIRVCAPAGTAGRRPRAPPAPRPLSRAPRWPRPRLPLPSRRRGSRRPAGPSRRCSTLRTASGATKHGAARPPRRRRGLPRSTGGVRPRPSEAVAHGAVDVAFRAHEAVTAREAGGVVVLAQQVGRVELERPVAPGELGVGVDQRVGGRTNAVGKGEPERTMRALVTHAAAEGQDRLGADREPPERPERGVLLRYVVDLHLGAVDLGLVVAEIGDQLQL